MITPSRGRFEGFLPVTGKRTKPRHYAKVSALLLSEKLAKTVLGSEPLT